MSELYRIGLTATRDGLAPLQAQSLFRFFKHLKPGELHEGVCIGGDEQAWVMAKSLGWRTVGHPGKVPARLQGRVLDRDEVRLGRPPLDRNRDIVDETEELVALPKGPEELRSGTWSTVRYARKLGRQITIIWPDGTVTVEPERIGAPA
jgi:hypothetical protein